MTPFLTIDEFTVASPMPAEDVAYVESLRPGYIAKRILHWSARVMARLRKRYPDGFQQPFPESIQSWIVAIVTVEAYEARGWDPSDAQSKNLIDEAEAAKKDIEEAANSETGLFDLPVSATNETSAITAPTPRFYTENGPFIWMDEQIRRARG